MNDISTDLLCLFLLFLILLSGFFSSSETGMMSINRYRVKHLAKSGHKGAKRVLSLLDRPDRLIGIILIGNNFVNILASSIATVIAIRLLGNGGIAIATLLLTIVILIFAEVTPKTLAALKPERIAYPASYILTPLLYLLYPLVSMVNGISNTLLKLFGFDSNSGGGDENLSQDELRTVVAESAALIPRKHRHMLLSVLDLENVTVNDIMVPRNEIFGIDIEDDIGDILEQLRAAQHTRIPIYRNNLNNPIGTLHVRRLMKFLNNPNISKTKSELLQYTDEPYYTYEGTSLHKQLSAFQKAKRRQALVVDEYGDILGLIALEDILEEIVGEFTTDLASSSKDIHPQPDGTYIIDGTATIRDINKALKWNLPSDGPKTLSGLITEQLENIPSYHVGFQINNYQIETLKLNENLVGSALVRRVVEPSTTLAVK